MYPFFSFTVSGLKKIEVSFIYLFYSYLRRRIEEDGKIYARGTLDDKGGVIASYYAMKMIRDLKLPNLKMVCANAQNIVCAALAQTVLDTEKFKQLCERVEELLS